MFVPPFSTPRAPPQFPSAVWHTPELLHQPESAHRPPPPRVVPPSARPVMELPAQKKQKQRRTPAAREGPPTPPSDAAQPGLGGASEPSSAQHSPPPPSAASDAAASSASDATCDLELHSWLTNLLDRHGFDVKRAVAGDKAMVDGDCRLPERLRQKGSRLVGKRYVTQRAQVSPTVTPPQPMPKNAMTKHLLDAEGYNRMHALAVDYGALSRGSSTSEGVAAPGVLTSACACLCRMWCASVRSGGRDTPHPAVSFLALFLHCSQTILYLTY